LTDEVQTGMLNSKLRNDKIAGRADERLTADFVKGFNVKNQTSFKTNEEIVAHLKKRLVDENNLFDGALKLEIGFAEARLSTAKRINDQIVKSNNAVNQDRTDRRKEQEAANKTARDKRLADVKAFNKRISDAQNELDSLENNAIEDKTEKEIRLLQAKYDKRILTLDSRIPQEQALILAYEEKLAKDIEAIEKRVIDEKVKKADEDLQKLIESDIKMQELRLKLMKGLVLADSATAEEIASNKLKIEDKSFDIEKQKLQAQLNNKKITQKEFNAEMLIIEQQHQNNINSIQKDSATKSVETMSEKISAWQTKNAEIIAKIQESFQVASQAISGIIDVVSQALNMRAEEDSAKRNDRFEADQEALKSSLANREITQQQFDDKLKALEKQKEIKERQAARKAFQQNKAMQITNAIMGTAGAIISGLSAPFPLGIVMAAINGAMGAAQIGIIASQKFKAARGGVVPGAPSKFDSVDAQLAPGEAVINSESTSMFPQLLSSINQIGGGVSLAPDVTPTQATGTQPVFRDNNNQDNRVYVVESDITDSQNRITRITEAATF